MQGLHCKRNNKNKKKLFAMIPYTVKFTKFPHRAHIILTDKNGFPSQK